MKKLDLHIHTVHTVSDKPFEFDLSILTRYISELSLDAIAITNHNQLDIAQYNEICSEVSIPVFPGIEIDLERGHLLVIASPGDISDFSSRCDKISSLISTATDFVSAAQFNEIFPTLNKYLLIPHYDKEPILDMENVVSLQGQVVCGEVSSPKKFQTYKKTTDKLTPVLFSDFRIASGVTQFPSKCTYVDVDSISMSSLKQAFTDKTKVALSDDEGHQLIDVLSNGLKISTGLTVLLGERSSGKTHTLDELANNISNHKYIRQFSLLAADASIDEKNFEKLLRNRSETIAEEYLRPFRDVVEDVRAISLEQDNSLLEAYISALHKSASEADRQDVFSKTRLFTESHFDTPDLNSLVKLIEAVNTVIANKEYEAIIGRFIDRSKLIELAIALMEQYAEEKELLLKREYVNEALDDIKSQLKVRTATTPIPEIDFYDLMLKKVKIQKYISIAQAVKNEKVIYTKELRSFKVVATALPYTGALEMKNQSGKVVAFSDAFEQYDTPYKFLCCLKNKPELSVSEYYKYFVNIKYEVRNRHGFRASGGERSEYNLLEQLSDATQYDILLLDEPESSFDNLFLKSDVNSLIKDISRTTPVIVATHNNTIGASIKPDYILYTRKKLQDDGHVTYQIFGGFPTSTDLCDLCGETIAKHDVLLDCLEAGEPAYNERRVTYEMSSN